MSSSLSFFLGNYDVFLRLASKVFCDVSRFSKVFHDFQGFPKAVLDMFPGLFLIVPAEFVEWLSTMCSFPSLFFSKIVQRFSGDFLAR